jgi:2-polyprenyl-3-methyl-5-hydroxy-6-metoxy-1,4-benzoquinol methylase
MGKTYIEYQGERYHERAHPDAYELALAAMNDVPPGDVLDVAAGAGYTSARLAARGHRVRAIDIHPEQFVPRAIPFIKADLNGRLPFDDATFDGVLALEIIEHLEAPRAFVRELARVVKPGGTVVVSTPNITSFRSKLRFLFASEFTLFFNAERRTRDPFCAEASGHISPILPWLLEIFLRDAGLEPRDWTWSVAELGIRSRHLAKTVVVRTERVAARTST